MGLRPWGECASVPAEAFVFFTIFLRRRQQIRAQKNAHTTGVGGFTLLVDINQSFSQTRLKHSGIF
jgi:hypothetical protein